MSAVVGGNNWFFLRRKFREADLKREIILNSQEVQGSLEEKNYNW